MKTQPWIVIFPGMTADAPVYANEDAARAMVERANTETAGNVEAVAMPLALAEKAPSLKSEVDALHKRLRTACEALNWINREILEGLDAKAIQKYTAAKVAELQRPLL